MIWRRSPDDLKRKIVKSKYIIIEHAGMEVPIVFASYLLQANVAEKRKVKAAGFCEIDADGKWVVGGKSASLDLSVRLQDADILNTHQAKTSPADAVRLISEQMSPGQFPNAAAISVLYQWAQLDAATALAWAESFPAGDLRERAIQEVKNGSAVSAGTQPGL